MVFPVVIFRYDSWTLKKAEHQRIDAFELVLEKTLENPFNCKEIKSIRKEINPEHSLEGLMLKLKLQYFGHPMRGVNIGKDPDAGKDWWQKDKGVAEDEMVI